MKVVQSRDVQTGGSKDDVEKMMILTDNTVTTHGTKNIKMKQYLSVKHALPKTRLTHAILHENLSQDRHLEMKLNSISHRRDKSCSYFDLTRRAFVAQQERKVKKWKREDEVRIAGMNLPNLGVQENDSRPDTKVMYHMPTYDTRTWSGGTTRKPVLPMLKIRRERTEIVSHQDKTFLTKLPSVVEVDYKKLEKHNSYCGKPLLTRGPSSDDRFRSLHSTLRPAKLRAEDMYPRENTTVQSKLMKFAKKVSNSNPCSYSLQDAKVIVASRPRSTKNKNPSQSVFPGSTNRKFDYVVQKRKKSELDIVESFKSKDIKELAKSLSKSKNRNSEKLTGGELTNPS